MVILEEMNQNQKVKEEEAKALEIKALKEEFKVTRMKLLVTLRHLVILDQITL
jgi:hypothetical protein